MDFRELKCEEPLHTQIDVNNRMQVGDLNYLGYHLYLNKSGYVEGELH